jgi:hypothetical protein
MKTFLKLCLLYTPALIFAIASCTSSPSKPFDTGINKDGTIVWKNGETQSEFIGDLIVNIDGKEYVCDTMYVPLEGATLDHNGETIQINNGVTFYVKRK